MVFIDYFSRCFSKCCWWKNTNNGIKHLGTTTLQIYFNFKNNFMKILQQFWDKQYQCNNVIICLLFCPFFIYLNIRFYNQVLSDSSIIMKLIHILFTLSLFTILFFRPYLFSYKTENILTDIHNTVGNTFEINVRPTLSITFIGKFKLIKFNCAPTSKASYVVVNNILQNYKQGDKISLLIGADYKVKQIL
jgi:hypothetical protein